MDALFAVRHSNRFLECGKDIEKGIASILNLGEYLD